MTPARGGVPTRAILAIAAAIEKAALYVWQFSVDDGVTWQNLPETSGANTKIEGLAPKVTVLVRFRAALRTTDVQTDWCDPVSIIVL